MMNEKKVHTHGVQCCLVGSESRWTPKGSELERTATATVAVPRIETEENLDQAVQPFSLPVVQYFFPFHRLYSHSPRSCRFHVAESGRECPCSVYAGTLKHVSLPKIPASKPPSWVSFSLRVLSTDFELDCTRRTHIWRQ